MIITVGLFLLSILIGIICLLCIGKYDIYYIYLIVLGIQILSYALLLGIYGLLLIFLGKKTDINKDVKEIKPFYRFIITQTAELALFFSNVHVKFEGKEKVPNEKCLFVCNHTSGYDAMAIIKCCKKNPLSIVTKIELINNIITGHLFHAGGFIHIDRSDDFQAAKALVKGIDFLKKDKASVCIFPEGTRNQEEGLLPYHAGSFKIAYKAKAPICALAIIGTDKIKTKVPFKRKNVTLKVVECLTYDEYKDMSTQELADSLREKTRLAIEEAK